MTLLDAGDYTKSGHILAVLVVVSLAFFAGFACVMAENMNDDKTIENGIGTPAPAFKRPSHAPIAIIGNANFTAANGVSAGSGTAGNPWVIEGWDITAPGAAGIYVTNTTEYFTIRNCSIHDCMMGIQFNMEWALPAHATADHCIIENNYIQNNMMIGIGMWWSSNCTVRHNNISFNTWFGMVNCQYCYFNDIYMNEFYKNTQNASQFCCNAKFCCYHQNNYLFNNKGTSVYDPSHIQARCWNDSSANLSYWNTSAGGNYWSDWTGPDSDHDGVVDNPYNITERDWHVVVAHDFKPQVQRIAGAGVVSKYMGHAPIKIVGNSNFTAANGVSAGDGTSGNPYIIEGWEISAANANGIEVLNVDAHFVIRNCVIHDGIANKKCGIRFNNTQHATIENNNCSFNRMGVGIFYSSNNTIQHNILSFNSKTGLTMCEYNFFNTVQYNEFVSNSVYGVDICCATIYFCHIDHNNFIDNHGAGATYDPAKKQAEDQAGKNYWNTSTEGNYWSDWTSPDTTPKDGIVDVPYIVNLTANSNDYYPLVGKVSGTGPVPEVFISTPLIAGAVLVLAATAFRTRKKDD